jgi:hypothetical protein
MRDAFVPLEEKKKEGARGKNCGVYVCLHSRSKKRAHSAAGAGCASRLPAGVISGFTLWTDNESKRKRKDERRTSGRILNFLLLRDNYVIINVNVLEYKFTRPSGGTCPESPYTVRPVSAQWVLCLATATKRERVNGQ